MKTEHLSPDDLALYVMGSLPPASTGALEEHVGRCAACAAALAREAAVEVALHEVGAALAEPLPSARPGEPASRRRRFGRAAGAGLISALAMAAGYLLWTYVQARPARAAEAPWVVACPPGRSEATGACRARARRMGLYVQDPPNAAIPVYESLRPVPQSVPRH
jgi:anti-sigma factor RsiW